MRVFQHYRKHIKFLIILILNDANTDSQIRSHQFIRTNVGKIIFSSSDINKFSSIRKKLIFMFLPCSIVSSLANTINYSFTTKNRM